MFWDVPDSLADAHDQSNKCFNDNFKYLKILIDIQIQNNPNFDFFCSKLKIQKIFILSWARPFWCFCSYFCPFQSIRWHGHLNKLKNRFSVDSGGDLIGFGQR